MVTKVLHFNVFDIQQQAIFALARRKKDDEEEEVETEEGLDEGEGLGDDPEDDLNLDADDLGEVQEGFDQEEESNVDKLIGEE